MNEQTAKIIESLATKLGTTAQYLWEVLIRQAQVSVIINLITITCTIIAGFVLVRLHKWGMTEVKGEYGGSETRYEKDDTRIFVIAMVIATIMWTIFVLISLFSIGDIITAMSNPQYWALQKILSKIQ